VRACLGFGERIAVLLLLLMERVRVPEVPRNRTTLVPLRRHPMPHLSSACALSLCTPGALMRVRFSLWSRMHGRYVHAGGAMGEDAALMLSCLVMMPCLWLSDALAVSWAVYSSRPCRDGVMCAPTHGDHT
jgi:hypothetical protein